jgi:ribosomal protein S18 acetylase RimI-like enzyme
MMLAENKCVEYRLLVESDWREWKRIRLESLADSPPAFGASFEEESVKEDSFFQDSIKNNAIFGAFMGLTLVGCVGVLQHKGDRYKHRGKVFGVYTAPSARGKGICKRLMEAAINYSKGKMLWLEIHVWTENPVAMKLYASLGFKTYAVELRSLRVSDDHYVDYHIMQLNLDS